MAEKETPEKERTVAEFQSAITPSSVYPPVVKLGDTMTWKRLTSDWLAKDAPSWD